MLPPLADDPRRVDRADDDAEVRPDSPDSNRIRSGSFVADALSGVPANRTREQHTQLAAVLRVTEAEGLEAFMKDTSFVKLVQELHESTRATIEQKKGKGGAS